MTKAIKILALGVALAATATMARADSITGSITITNNNDTWNGTGVTFNPTAPGTSPNAGAYGATGSFGTFASTGGSLTTSPADVFNFNYNQTSGLLFAVGYSTSDYLEFTISSMTVETNNSTFLNVNGSGVISEVGGTTYTPTDATFSFTSTNTGSTSFTINSAPTPEPSSLALLGTGLLGAAGIARRRFMAR